jgi:integrase
MRNTASQTKLRTRVERGIFKRHTRDGETRYEIAYADSDGRQRWRTVRTLTEARQLRAEMVTRVASGEHVAPSKLTLGEFADDWLAQQQSRLRPTTHTLYTSYLRHHVRPRLGARKLSSITVDDVAALIADMEQGWRYRKHDGRLERVQGKPFAAWTIRGVLVVLGRVLGRAARIGLINANPVGRLEKDERPKSERREFPALDKEMIATLIAKTPERYRALIAVSALTGIRQGEALGLRWQDVDTKVGVIRVRFQLDRTGHLVEPKTAAAKREIPIPPSLARTLTAHKQEAFARGHAKPSDFVFASETGSALNHRNITRRGLEKALEAGKLPKIRWHDLRHVAASALIVEGASVPYLSRILGHANPAITLAIYAHEFARAEHADRTRERMEQAFGTLLDLDRNGQALPGFGTKPSSCGGATTAQAGCAARSNGAGGSGSDDDLPAGVAVSEVADRRWNLVERKRPVDDRLDRAVFE